MDEGWRELAAEGMSTPAPAARWGFRSATPFNSAARAASSSAGSDRSSASTSEAPAIAAWIAKPPVKL